MDSISPDIPQRQCMRCFDTKPFTEFYPSTVNIDGVAHVCKACNKLIREKKILGVREVYKQERISPRSQKRCQACKELLDITPENFSHLKKSPDGFRDRCKKCDKLQHQKSQEKYRRLHQRDERDTSHKRCAGPCGQMLPATLEFFNKKLKGLSAWCRPCLIAKARANYVSLRKPKPPKPDVQPCTKCGKPLPFTEEYFSPNKHSKYGLKPSCKSCQEAWRVEYGKAKPELIARHARSRRARKKAVQGTHTVTQIQEQLKRQKYCCYYAACGFSKFPKVGGKYQYHVEHTFPISRVAGTDIPANDMGYIVLACESCNERKQNKFPWEWPEGGRLL